ncbi:MAG: helix-turn-helix domain-containing protein [Sphingomicrobium sp.]
MAKGKSAEDHLTIGGRMAWARLRKKMTQKDLAAHLGKSRTTIVQYESNTINPTFETLNEIAQELDVDPSYIAFGGLRRWFDAPAEDTKTIPCFRVEGGSRITEGVMNLPSELVRDLELDDVPVEIVALSKDAPAFGYRRGDRVVIDASRKGVGGDKNLFLMRSGASVDMMQTLTLSGPALGDVLITFGDSQMHRMKADEVDVMGAVLCVIKRV